MQQGQALYDAMLSNATCKDPRIRSQSNAARRGCLSLSPSARDARDEALVPALLRTRAGRCPRDASRSVGRELSALPRLRVGLRSAPGEAMAARRLRRARRIVLVRGWPHLQTATGPAARRQRDYSVELAPRSLSRSANLCGTAKGVTTPRRLASDRFPASGSSCASRSTTLRCTIRRSSGIGRRRQQAAQEKRRDFEERGWRAFTRCATRRTRHVLKDEVAGPMRRDASENLLNGYPLVAACTPRPEIPLARFRHADLTHGHGLRG